MLILITFWMSLLLIIYHYIIFPIIVFLLARMCKNQIRKEQIFPHVSLIIAAYNEDKVIEEKIKNCFELDYPKDLLEIIIVSDGSTDSTPAIVEQYKKDGVISLFDPPRRGKTAALNRAIHKASGEIVIFSDANSMYDKNAVKMLVRNFHEPDVGGVTGRKSILQNPARESSRGDKMFWDFESQIKMKQSLIGSITTGDGEIFAIRKKCYSDIPETIINDDTAITFNIINQGYRVVYEPEAVSFEEASIVLKDDYNVKVRMVCGGYQTLAEYADMLFPPKTFFSYQFLSHKVLRWIMPIMLMTLFISNLFLKRKFYKYLLLAQIIFYSMAGLGYIIKMKSKRIISILYLPLYYCNMNIAALYGLIAYIKGLGNVNIWKKASR